MRVAECNAPTMHQFLMAQRCTQDASTMIHQIETVVPLATRQTRDLEKPVNDWWLRLAIKPLTYGKETQSGSSHEPVETSGVFGQLDEIKKREMRDVLDNIRQIASEDSERIYNRLLNLVENAEEEYAEEGLVSISSLRGFEKFLKGAYHWRYPDIVVSPNGNIIIEWFKDKNNHVAIEFVGQATAKLVMLVPDITLKSKVVPVVTKPRVESIAEAVKPYDVLSWVTQ